MNIAHRRAAAVLMTAALGLGPVTAQAATGQFKNTLGWVDVATGELHEIGTEGERFRERPAPEEAP
jgi:hypothetical protein